MRELKARRELARRVYDRMMDVMLGFTSCEQLRIGDMQYIARMARTCAFDALSAETPDDNA